MEYRVENKYFITEERARELEACVGAICERDPHGEVYEVHSVYFDDPALSCLRDNESGEDPREKFRLRTYGSDNEIKLELKSKKSGFTKKIAMGVTKEEAKALIAGDHSQCFPRDKEAWLLKKLGALMLCRRMRAKVLISYERTAFVHPVGNVRVTIDRNISSSRDIESFLSEKKYTVPVLDVGVHILEVKYDEILPDGIRMALNLGRCKRCAFSKYYYGSVMGRSE